MADDYNDSMRNRGLPDKPHEFQPQEYARDFCAFQPTPESPRCNLSRMNTMAHTTKLEGSEPALEPCPLSHYVHAGLRAHKTGLDPRIVCLDCGLTLRAPDWIKVYERWQSRARVSANGVPAVDHESHRDYEAGFLRTIAEGLRHAIRDHGPITSEWIGSASKRVYSRLKGTKYVK